MPLARQAPASLPGTAQPAAQHGSSPADLERWAAAAGNLPYLFEQVTRGVEVASHGNRGWHLQLDPPLLGALRIEVEIGPAGLSARVEAARVATRQLLTDHLPQLKEALVAQGLQVDRLQVELATEQQRAGGGSAGPFSQSPGGEAHQRERQLAEPPRQPKKAAAQSRAPRSTGRGTDALDVIV
jgi:flagellar hook-length control protein FliK